MPTWLTGNGLWTDPTRWAGGVPDAPGAIAQFSSPATGATETIEVAEGTSNELGYMYVLNGTSSNIVFKGWGGDSGTGTGELVFDNGALLAQLVINTSISSSTLFLGTDGLRMRLVSDLVVDVITSGSTVIFNLPVVGSGQLIKTGTGILDLRGSNSFTGGIDLVGGILSVANSAAVGSGAVSFSNDAIFLSQGAIDSFFVTPAGLFGAAGSGRIVAATGTGLNLTGQLHHLSEGTLSFGSATYAGTVTASFTAFAGNPGGSTFVVEAGTLAFGNQFNAANLLTQSTNDTTTIGNGLLGTNATLNTNGFFAEVTNLQLNQGTVRAGASALDLTIHYSLATQIQQRGTIEGTVGADIVTVLVQSNYNFGFIDFASWNPAADVILMLGNDTGNAIGGSETNDEIYGFGGDDFLGGNGGADLIFGGLGDDGVILFDNGDGSSIHGGDGDDQLLIQVGSPGATVTLSQITGFEQLTLIGGADLVLTGAQFASGFAINSRINGVGTVTVNMGAATVFNARAMSTTSNVEFVINGTAANDAIKVARGASATINTGNGSNVVQGSDENDTITGGTGIDKISGNQGIDIMTGGGGADVFKFRAITDSGLGFGADQILDFVSGTDKLNFARIDTNAAAGGDQAFAYIGTAAFSGTGAAQIRWSDIGAHLLVSADMDGDGNSDLDILLIGAGTQTLTAADFVL